tara:strand:- start:824 stop:1639 length:816 start_codon:yes stop_codon:yes gene_type:complete
MEGTQEELQQLQAAYSEACAVYKATRTERDIYTELCIAAHYLENIVIAGAKVSITLPDGRTMLPNEAAAVTFASSIKWQEAAARKVQLRDQIAEHPDDKTFVNENAIHFTRVLKVDGVQNLQEVVYYDIGEQKKIKAFWTIAQVAKWVEERKAAALAPLQGNDALKHVNDLFDRCDRMHEETTSLYSDIRRDRSRLLDGMRRLSIRQRLAEYSKKCTGSMHGEMHESTAEEGRGKEKSLVEIYAECVEHKKQYEMTPDCEKINFFDQWRNV